MTARLVKRGNLEIINQTKGGWRGGSTSAILLPPTSRAKVPNAHTLDVTELYVLLVENHFSQPGKLVFDPEPFCHFKYGQIELKPDGFIKINRMQWWLELDRGTEWRGALTRKMRGYANAYKNWPRDVLPSRTFPRVLFVVPDTDRARMVRGVADRMDADIFTVCLTEDALKILT